MDYDVFISYSRQDGNEYAEKLQKELETAGFRVWRDTRNINPNQDFTAEIEIGIKHSGAVALCLTPDTQRDNSFVRREIQYALAEQRPVFPCRVRPITPHISIINHEWLEFHVDWKKAFDRLCAIIRDPNLQKSPGTYEKPPEDPFREYLQALYQQIVDYLNRAVIRLIDLQSEETPDAVPRKRTDDMLLDFFDAAGLSVEQPIAAGHRYDSFTQAFEQHKGRLLLLGEPGAGKTITLMSYAREAVAARLDDAQKPLPVLKTVATWPSPPVPIVDWAAENLNGLKAEIEAGRALLLLDGLDELGSSRPINPDKPEKGTYDPRQRFIDAVAKIPPRNQILVTCRMKDYAAIGPKIPLEGAITLQPLSDELLREYLRDHPRIYDAIQADDALHSLVRTPLLLSLIAFAWNNLDADLQKRGDLHSGDVRDAIFAAYIRQRYAHEARKKNANLLFTLEKMLEVLGHAAMINAGEGRGFARLLSNNGSENVPGRRNFILLQDEQIDAFCALACDLHILYRRDDKTHSFLHLLLRDHLAYTYSVRDGLGDRNREIRRTAVKILQKLGGVRAVEPLITALADTDTSIHRLSARVLGELADTSSTKSFIRALQHENSSVRYEVVNILRLSGDFRAIEPLINALADVDSKVRIAAAGALGQIGDVRAVEPLINALADTYPEVRQEAAFSLGRLGDVRAIEPLINAMGNMDSEARVSAIYTLGELGEPALFPLLNALAHESATIRWSATLVLERLADTRAIEPLINILADRSSEVRQAVAFTLGRLGDSRVVEPLINVLTDTDSEVRWAATVALGQLGDARAIASLINALEDINTDVCMSAAAALGQIGGPALFPLLDTLVHENAMIRVSAAMALGQLGDTRAVPALIKSLKDTEQTVFGRVCGMAARALIQIGTPEAWDVVIEWERGDWD